ncbi:MAG: hypothetical protein HQL69_05145 [Magnetococcales bacterium]|nr:hypothetical protein [Magnetococcales bacterium]
MPLKIDREHVAKPNGPAPVYIGGLGRIVSGMKVTNIDDDSVGLSSFMKSLSSLYSQDQVEQFGVENSVR